MFLYFRLAYQVLVALCRRKRCYRMRRSRAAISAILRNEEGSAAIEFSILSVPFFGMVLLIMQVGLYHFAVQSLDFATRQAGRMVMTGAIPTSITTGNQFKAQTICGKTFWLMSCDKIVVNAYKVASSSDASSSSGIYAFINAQTKRMNAPAAASQSFCLGKPGDYIYIDVAYDFPNFVKKLLSSVAPNTQLLRSSTFVFNEPYKNASAQGSC